MEWGIEDPRMGHRGMPRIAPYRDRRSGASPARNLAARVAGSVGARSDHELDSSNTPTNRRGISRHTWTNGRTNEGLSEVSWTRIGAKDLLTAGAQGG